MDTQSKSGMNVYSMCHKLGRFEQEVKERDVREIVVALIMVPFFVYVAVQKVSLLWQVGGWVMVAGLIFITAYLRWHRLRTKVEPTESEIAPYLTYWKRCYEDQIRLLQSVLWWYLLPGLSGAVLIIAGVAIVIPKWSVLLIFFFLLAVIFITIIGGFVLWLNRSYAVRKLKGNLLEIEELLTSIKNDSAHS